MILRSIAAPALAALLTLGAGAAMGQGYPQQNYPQQPQYQQQQPQYQQGQPGYPQQGGYGDRGGWDAPPQDFRSDMQRQGFRDGIAGARQDFQYHRAPNSAARIEFRHPPVPRPGRNEYREGFQRGYDVATRHMMEHHDDRDDHHDHDDHRDGYPR